MKNGMMTALAAVTLITLAGCGGKGDDTLGEQTEEAAENKADALDAAADAQPEGSNAEDALEAQADATRDEGERKEEAIDDADVNADAMTPAQKAATVNAM